MRAAVYRRYGPPSVVHIEEVPTPVPGPNDILIRVRATSVAAADWRLRRAKPQLVRLMNGLTKPRIQILGTEMSGVVEAIGSEVKRFAVGDEVFGSVGLNFGA